MTDAFLVAAVLAPAFLAAIALSEIIAAVVPVLILTLLVPPEQRRDLAALIEARRRRCDCRGMRSILRIRRRTDAPTGGPE